jgi:murein DD-endopeptidase MepM/ murein hydrolase activator NlpD
MKGGKTATGYTVTSGYGAMHTPTQTSGKVPHTGIDMVSATREIVATMKGKVIFAGEHPDGTGTATGTLIIIKYDNGEYGLYGHLDKASFNVKAGDEVNEGADLGKYYNSGKEGDNMGVSGGPHLHYGRYKLDDSKKEDKVTNINDFAKSFNATGYFYGKEKVPEDKKIKDGFTSVEPRFDK